MRHGRLRQAGALAASTTLVLGLAACAESARDTGAGGNDKKATDFVFAASSDPKSLDPAFASDGESFRVARQVFEGLVGTKPGTADPAPGLAESWTAADDGLSYTFKLHDGVKFHDGTDFNADAVCTNFERWYNFTGVLQSENISYYWQKLFKGFKTSDDPKLAKSVYKNCEAKSPTEVTINLNEPFAAFVPAMSLPAFSISSPEALKKFEADKVTGSGEAPQFGPYATEHPTGTGPFKFEKWERGQSLTLTKNDDYWGEKAKVDRVTFRVIEDPNARKQALQSGSINGYDLVAPGDVQALKDAGFQVVNRDPFNVLYLAFNQARPEFKDIRVRQAIAHAINKDQLVKSTLPEGTKVATQFIPDLVAGYNPDVKTYEYDPEKAKALLKAAGKSNLEVEFNYPTGVSRPYMPTPEQTFTQIKADLEAVGITVKPQPDKWSPDYLDRVTGTPKHGIHLLGWTGDYNSTDNFLGVFFGGKTAEWGFDNPGLFKALTAARGMASEEEQIPAYKKINADVMEFLPGVPIAHPVPSLAFDKKVQGYPASPVQDEVYNVVSVG
ncbi:MAG: ABC transporter substrate-binding protein [Actinomycetota bacterium]|nr:ABC transporter substrate-binding protein [Actinomycetota bacterium]